MDASSILLFCLLAAIVVLNVFDAVSTNLNLSKRRGVEANPAMRFVMDHLGSYWWVVKVPVLVLMIWFSWAYKDSYPAYVRLGVGLTFAFYVYLVVNNYRILWRKH